MNGKFVVRPMGQEKVVGKILLSQSTKMPYERATVLEIPSTNYHEGVNIPHEIMVGDVVFIDPDYGYEIGDVLITGYHKIIGKENKE